MLVKLFCMFCIHVFYEFVAYNVKIRLKRAGSEVGQLPCGGQVFASEKCFLLVNCVASGEQNQIFYSQTQPEQSQHKTESRNGKKCFNISVVCPHVFWWHPTLHCSADRQITPWDKNKATFRHQSPPY